MRESEIVGRIDGRAAFAAALSKLKVMRLGAEKITLTEMMGSHEVEGEAFRIIGAGIDSRTFVVAIDPFIKAAPVYGVAFMSGATHLGFIDGTNRRGTAEEAMLEGVKFVLRQGEPEERAAFFDAWVKRAEKGAKLAAAARKRGPKKQ